METLIRKLLHHRPPYLMVDKIIHLDEERIHTQKIPEASEYYLQGHFPGTPVVPGAMMQEMTTQAAGLLITKFYSPVPDYDSERTQGHALGVLRAVHSAKFKSFARPSDVLDIKVTLTENNLHSFRFKGVITKGEEKIMTNDFTLINITEDKLKGIL
ncbi:MAG: 3-hydroxyacyl-ACP dehydratase FabZ family protein [Bacteriovoracaceae bacterium]